MAKKAKKENVPAPSVTGVVRRIPLKEIVPSGNNPRKVFNPDELDELAQSIRENGLLQPIIVRPVQIEGAQYEIVCGERRYRATLLTGAEEIDCVVKELDDKSAFAAMVLENMQRKDVDPMEEASAVTKLVSQYGMEVGQISKMLGKSDSFVYSRLRLNETIDEFVDLMHNGPLVLTHLLEICKLPRAQQKTLYDACFTPECIARWKYKFPNIPQLKEMIDANVLMKLGKATFSLTDDSFEHCPACQGCALNTATNPANKGEMIEPMCMNRACFLDKTRQRIFREAKQLPEGTQVVYQGEYRDSEAILSKAKEAGIVAVPMGARKYVVDPQEPKKEDFTEQEFYVKRMDAWKHQKALFDIGVKDGNIVPVYEICYAGHLSGQTKYAYNVQADATNDNELEKQNRQEMIMRNKELLTTLDQKREDEKIELLRQEIEKSEFGSLNTELSDTEKAIFLAIVFKHLPYEFKQRLGLEWTMSKDSLDKNKETLAQNENAVMREYIRVSLAEKSVNFSKDLQGMLEAIMKERYESTLDEIDKNTTLKYGKQKENLKAKIETLKAVARNEKAKEKEETAKQPAVTPDASNAAPQESVAENAETPSEATETTSEQPEVTVANNVEETAEAEAIPAAETEGSEN